MKTNIISQLATHLQLNKVQTMYLETKIEQLITEARMAEWDLIHETLHSANLVAGMHIDEVMTDRIEALKQNSRRREDED